MSKLNIIINERIVQGRQGESILDLARRLNIEIPTLCHDPRLEPYSSCYLCVVEVESMRGLQPACSTKISEGMRILTDSDRVVKSRKFALELMVSNHYADCVAPCKETCPAGVDVQGYIALINQGKHREATGLIKNTNPLPAICGRVCVRPCEVACRRNLVEGVGVGIDYLKRYTSDIDLVADDRYMPEVKTDSGKRTAVIGAGPGGLSAAYFLACEGHSVEIFEASPAPGGMLRYGIPPYRLPNEIIEKEVEGITALGVKIHYNKKLGDNLSYKELKNNFDAVVLAIGSQKGTSIGCENDDAGNIFSGIDFLRNMEMTGQKYDFTGKKVAVIGGGNTAMDCCRTAMRCGSTDVTVLYRRTEKEMPANPIEIHESKLEGINYMFLTAPARVNKDEDGNLKSLSCFKMELGEPDASGRRRPVKIDGSEFDVELDYILAAIGQKTTVNFIDDISSCGQELKINKWGDIDADPSTLQTSIENIFACGDGVTGPATLIEAIAQGRLAAKSCSKFLTGDIVTPQKFEFLSRKENFCEQKKEDYTDFYVKQNREEMPTLEPSTRQNFNEVELGYTPEQALQETHRCLECGCSEYFSCDLKKYSTQYQVEQKRFGGDYQKFSVEFSHPHIEIDNNKCILCGRCVRICKEVVGANALGLVNRGFETYVAPSLGNQLSDTNCESCGMCISTCPTGALSENVPFKAGPLKLDSFKSICNHCSVGCELEYHHKAGFVTKVSGSKGYINKEGNICRLGRFGYKYLNNPDRITTPLLKVNGEFQPISYEEAYKLIIEKIQSAKPDQNAFFAGARLTNEEIYLIQKLARAAAGTHNISSFHYLERSNGHLTNANENVPFNQLSKAGRIYLLGSEVNIENGVAGFYISNNCYQNNIPLVLVSTLEMSSMKHKADEVIKVKSYYHFIKAVIFYLLENGLENQVYLKDHCPDFEQYKQNTLAEDLKNLVNQSGYEINEIAEFAQTFNKEQHAVLVFSEAQVCHHTAIEIKNLCLITGKTGKTASGMIALKEKNNSQGIFDMGAHNDLSVGGHNIHSKEVLSILEKEWNVKLPAPGNIATRQLLEQGKDLNLFVFGEDPCGTAFNKSEVKPWFSSASFVMVQDYFMTETALQADLILPASLPFESGGSFSNTHKIIQQFGQTHNHNKGVTTGVAQLAALHKAAGLKEGMENPAEVLLEVASILEKLPSSDNLRKIIYTNGPGAYASFRYGADNLLMTQY